MLVVQNELRPAEIQNALLDLMRGGITEVRVCCAYATLAGSKILLDGISRSAVWGDPGTVCKTIVTSLDFGLTEPAAIEFWQEQPNSRVLVAGTKGLSRGDLAPSAAFHPKIYAFEKPGRGMASLVGSANLTSRGLTINTEVAWSHSEGHPATELTAAWKTLMGGAVPVTPEVLSDYASLRRRANPGGLAKELKRVPEPKVGPLNQYKPFGEVHLPGVHDTMWVQSLGMQGGARTQLELPRGAHRFFGAAYDQYDVQTVDRIADVVLVSGQRQWNDRFLRWHGDNAMERINLPSQRMGGFEYEQSLILFRRIGDERFELRVFPWGSDSARAYVEASRRARLLYRVGRSSPRLFGFLAPI